MTDIRFYHLEKSNVFEAMPKLLHKVSDMGITGHILVPDSMLETFSTALWQKSPSASFLAHSLHEKEAGSGAVFVLSSDYTKTDETLFCIDKMPDALHSDVKTLCYMFNGNDAYTIGQARQFWKKVKANDAVTLAYYQQTNSGGWLKKI